MIKSECRIKNTSKDKFKQIVLQPKRRKVGRRFQPLQIYNCFKNMCNRLVAPATGFPQLKKKRRGYQKFVVPSALDVILEEDESDEEQ
ncbi:hypothetical protein J6590_053798 [Homalodisca vitripennis]|nr:hypothetical protein J6590_053798 [Homalodisca vitripennis]